MFSRSLVLGIISALVMEPQLAAAVRSAGPDGPFHGVSFLSQALTGRSRWSGRTVISPEPQSLLAVTKDVPLAESADRQDAQQQSDEAADVSSVDPATEPVSSPSPIEANKERRTVGDVLNGLQKSLAPLPEGLFKLAFADFPMEATSFLTAGGETVVILLPNDRVLKISLYPGLVARRPFDAPILEHGTRSVRINDTSAPITVYYVVQPLMEVNESISDEEAEAFISEVQDQGYAFVDPKTGNMGRWNGKLWVIDPMAVISREEEPLYFRESDIRVHLRGQEYKTEQLRDEGYTIHGLNEDAFIALENDLRAMGVADAAAVMGSLRGVAERLFTDKESAQWHQTVLYRRVTKNGLDGVEVILWDQFTPGLTKEMLPVESFPKHVTGTLELNGERIPLHAPDVSTPSRLVDALQLTLFIPVQGDSKPSMSPQNSPFGAASFLPLAFFGLPLEDGIAAPLLWLSGVSLVLVIARLFPTFKHRSPSRTIKDHFNRAA